MGPSRATLTTSSRRQWRRGSLVSTKLLWRYLRTSRPASPVDDDLLLSPPPPLFAEDWGARCSSPELWAHVGDLVEEPDVTYAGGFPEDYSDVFGAPAAALPAF